MRVFEHDESRQDSNLNICLIYFSMAALGSDERPCGKCISTGSFPLLGVHVENSLPTPNMRVSLSCFEGTDYAMGYEILQLSIIRQLLFGIS